MNSLSVFLQLLEDMNGNELFRHEWEQNLGEDFTQIAKLFLTKMAPNSRDRFEVTMSFPEEAMKKKLGPAPGGGTWEDAQIRNLLRPAYDWMGWEWHHLCKVIARALDLAFKHVEFIQDSTHQLAE
jgi:hypothetical protein